MNQGDLVYRKSYGGDVIFTIKEFTNRQLAILKGVDYRLMADAPIGDLMKAGQTQLDRMLQMQQQKAPEAMRRMAQHTRTEQDGQTKSADKKNDLPYSYFEVPGKVLHIDGDLTYLRKSMSLYGELRIPAEGFYASEENMPQALYRLLPQVKPDILVITGHDGILKHRKYADINNLNNYKNSHNFVNAVKIARQYERSRDALIIIAGACQSHFEALLQAGANFASSPARVLIHALDPLYIAAKSAFTSIKDTINITDVIEHTVSGIEGLGGVETRGSYRIGLPNTLPAALKDNFQQMSNK